MSTDRRSGKVGLPAPALTLGPGAGCPTTRQRWLARLSLLLAALAVVIVAIFAGLKSLAMLAAGLGAAAVSLTAAYFFLSRRGVWRWLSLGAFILAPIAVIVIYAFKQVLWVALVFAAVWLLATMTARSALVGNRADWRMPEHPPQPPASHPYLIMNPKSGGGKVDRFDLKRKAEEAGAEVFVMNSLEPVDVAQVARKAIADGADLLGVAGGDGTQALVAEVAAEHGIPFVVITAGTRNHFGLDLGLDRDDPSNCLRAVSDGVELHVDLGVAGGRTFVNNSSFGAYAEIVKTPAYRGDKLNTTLELLPDLIQGHRGARLWARAGEVEITTPQALLVANNPYGTGDIAGLGRRVRLDRGQLGVIGINVATAQQAVALLVDERAAGLSVLTAPSVEVTSDVPEIPIGIDGEAVSLPTPVRCSIRPGALRVWVPRDRPGVPPPKPPVSWARLLEPAAPRARGSHPGGPDGDGAVRGPYHRATGLPEVVRRAGELRARTTVIDVEPLIAHWSSDQDELDRGIAMVLDALAAISDLQVVCFSTNSARRPSNLPCGSGRRVLYLASALKPLRTAAYRRFPRPGMVIGDQIPTDGILARRLGYAFVLYDARVGRVPLGPRLMRALGRLIRPLLFRHVD